MLTAMHLFRKELQNALCRLSSDAISVPQRSDFDFGSGRS